MKANELIEKIKGTNNGYLFAPTGEELETARRCKSCFAVVSMKSSEFPFRIMNLPPPFTRSLETPISTNDGWRIAGWDWIAGQTVKTEYFEKYFLTMDEAAAFHGEFIAGTHTR